MKSCQLASIFFAETQIEIITITHNRVQLAVIFFVMTRFISRLPIMYLFTRLVCSIVLSLHQLFCCGECLGCCSMMVMIIMMIMVLLCSNRRKGMLAFISLSPSEMVCAVWRGRLAQDQDWGKGNRKEFRKRKSPSKVTSSQ